MTAFDNIKVNNWPATSNEFEDFLVLKLPLNDTAGLTESLPVVVGSKTLSAKQTLTNNGVIAQPATPKTLGYVANVKLHTYIYNTPGTLTVNGTTVPRGSDPNGDVTFTVAVNGDLNSIAWSYDSSSGPYCYMRGIEVDYGDGNGYQLLTDGSTNYSNLISGTADSTYPLSNLFGGTIGTGYNNGTRSTNPGTLTLDLAGDKNHYDNHADFGPTTSDKYLLLAPSSDLSFGQNPFCIECWALIKETSISALWDLNTGAGFQNEDWISSYYDSNGMYFYWGVGSSYAGINTSIPLNVWTHWAWTWDGTTARLFKNGSLANSATPTKTHWGASNRDFYIGKQNYDAPNRLGSAKIQDFRIYKGAAKYTANFTPPPAILG